MVARYVAHQLGVDRLGAINRREQGSGVYVTELGVSVAGMSSGIFEGNEQAMMTANNTAVGIKRMTVSRRLISRPREDHKGRLVKTPAAGGGNKAQFSMGQITVVGYRKNEQAFIREGPRNARYLAGQGDFSTFLIGALDLEDIHVAFLHG